MGHKTGSDALLTTLSHLTARLEMATKPSEVLMAIADGARGILPFTACALALPEPWHVWRATSIRPTEVTENQHIPSEAAETLSRFIDHGQFLLIDDLLAPPWSESSHRDVLWKDGTRSAMLIALTTRGGTYGAFSFTSVQANRYSIADRDCMELLAWMIAITLRALPQENSLEIEEQEKIEEASKEKS